MKERPKDNTLYKEFTIRRQINIKRENILKMTPGRELNRMVAEEVMGHEVIMDEVLGDSERFVDGAGASIWGNLTPYSEDIDIAEAVINKAAKLGFTDVKTWWNFGSGSYQPAEAVCKKALLNKMKIEE